MLRASAYSLLVVAAGALMVSCDVVGSDECGPEVEATAEFGRALLNANTANELYNDPSFSSFLLAGKRHFNWSFLVEGICASEHARPIWFLMVERAHLPPGWEVTASYATSALTSTDVTLPVSDLDLLFRKYSLIGDVGMQQGSILGRAQLAFDIEFAFTSQGDLSTDMGVAQGLHPQVTIEILYKAAKASASGITSP